MVEISVIIPVYNVKEYLKECLDSVINQSFEDIEIICIDDGSTDGSLNILNKYSDNDSRVRIITQKNKGAGAARNAGLNKSNGKYIYFIDADDYLNPDALNKMYYLSQERNLDLLLFKLLNFNEKTHEKDYDYSNMPFLLDIGKDVFSYKDFKDDLLKVDVSPCNKFFKRELIENKKFLEGLIFEDNAFYIDYIFDAERIFFLDEILYNRRIRADSIITEASKKYADIIEIYDYIYQKFKDRGLYHEFREKLFMRKIDIIYYRFTLIQQEYKQYYYQQMKKSFSEQENEYENELDLNKIDDYTKNLFHAVLHSKKPDEVDLYLKTNQLKSKLDCLKKENKKLKQENARLNQTNHEMLSSKSWKITAPLRKLKRDKNG